MCRCSYTTYHLLLLSTCGVSPLLLLCVPFRYLSLYIPIGQLENGTCLDWSKVKGRLGGFLKRILWIFVVQNFRSKIDKDHVPSSADIYTHLWELKSPFYYKHCLASWTPFEELFQWFLFLLSILRTIKLRMHLTWNKSLRNSSRKNDHIHWLDKIRSNKREKSGKDISQLRLSLLIEWKIYRNVLHTANTHTHTQRCSFQLHGV